MSFVLVLGLPKQPTHTKMLFCSPNNEETLETMCTMPLVGLEDSVVVDSK
jgi:hypothetical protein